MARPANPRFFSSFCRLPRPHPPLQITRLPPHRRLPPSAAAMSALQTSLLLRPLSSSLPPRRRLPLPPASAYFPRSPHNHRRLPLSLHALAADGPQPAPSPSPEPPAASTVAAAPEAEGETGPATKDGEEELEDLVEKATVWTVAFTATVAAAARRFFDWVVSGDWMSWWPFWRPNRRLQRLIDDADADPKDAAKQSALLHELNKFRLQDLLSV